LCYPGSGIITHVGGRSVHRLREESSGAQVERRVLSQPVHRKATYMCDDTRRCIIQFLPPDDEHNSARNMYRPLINLL